MNIIDTLSLSTEIALLGFVYRQPAHGYEIYQRLVQTPELRLIWRFKQSRLYAMLSRLEAEGYLIATHEPQDGRPPRKVFHLTKTGQTAFDEWLAQPVSQPRDMRLVFMLKLYFAAAAGDETMAALIQRQRDVCAQWLSVQERESQDNSPFVRAVRAYRRRHIEAIQEWLAADVYREGE